MAISNSAPLAELHLHLEGAVDAELLRQLDPSLTIEEAESNYRFDSFQNFLQAFKFVVMRLREPDHYRLAARSLFAKLHQEGVVYAEVIHSAGVNIWRGIDASAIVEALIEEGKRAPLEVRWILDGVRQFGADHLLATARLAADFAGDEVIAFGVGGDESGASVGELREAFELAKRSGLRLTAHAGETSDAQNVWDALMLGAERIGHGIRSINDPDLVAHLAGLGIPLEISLSSNLFTRSVSSMDLHPAKRLFDAGVPIILNTDDPALFRTSLRKEYALAATHLGFSEVELEQIRRNAFRYAFAYRGLPATGQHPLSR